MSRYTTKLQNIQEANARLEQRLLNEQTAPATKYIQVEAKINANARKISDKINQSIVPDEDEKLRAAKKAISDFAVSAKNGQNVTAQELADFAKTNDYLDTVINTIVNKI